MWRREELERAETVQTKREIQIPYVARQYLTRYEPALRAEMRAVLEEKLQADPGRLLSWEDLSEAVNSVLSAFRTTVDEIRADARMKRIAIEAMRKGDFVSSKDYISELRSSLAQSGTQEGEGI